MKADSRSGSNLAGRPQGGEEVWCGEPLGRGTRASRVSILVDNASYFKAAAAAITQARASIFLLGWQFDFKTKLDPRSSDQTIGSLLKDVARQRPGLQVHILIWRMALPISAAHHLMPYRAIPFFAASSVEFRLDRTAPLGACRHEKLLVVDDKLAFCSGDDFARNRWDDMHHHGSSEARRMVFGGWVPPRHGATMMIEGEAAGILADSAREQWRRATGQEVPPRSNAPADRIWPSEPSPDFTDVPLCISRTVPAEPSRTPAREVEASFLRQIAGAAELIYIENQYFTSARIAEALLARLREEKGPEVVLVTGEHSPNIFDRATMDPARDMLLNRLEEEDTNGRFRAYAPYAEDGTPILVHSKLMIVDDEFIRIGSGNVANRSLGLDTECDITVYCGGTSAERERVSWIRSSLVSHFLGLSPEHFRDVHRRTGGLAKTIAALQGPAESRLRGLRPAKPSILGQLIGRFSIGDPHGPADSWRPWIRRRPVLGSG